MKIGHGEITFHGWHARRRMRTIFYSSGIAREKDIHERRCRLHLAPLAGRGGPAKRSEGGRVRGTVRESRSWREPLTPPSPREERGEGARKSDLSHCVLS